MDQPYTYESNKNQELANSTEAIIMLPDIYCQTDYAKRTVDELVEAFNKPVFMLDYFYVGTKQANNFGEDDRDAVHELMDNFSGDDFLKFYQQATAEIQQAYPSIKQFVVIGFCFGGRLAYIAGGEANVPTVLSFYGGSAHEPNYVAGKSPIEYLVGKRGGSSLQVVSFFGTQDESIPAEDRAKTKELFTNASINYVAHEYDAGHAYFQEGRPNYNEAAANKSWEVLRQSIK